MHRPIQPLYRATLPVGKFVVSGHLITYTITASCTAMFKPLLRS